MIHSMTAFASTQTPIAGLGNAQWEVRSVNGRYLDITVRLPEAWRCLEPALRQRLASAVARGKIEVRLSLEPETTAALLALDVAMLQALAQAQAQVRAVLPDAAPLTVAEVLRWPGVIAGAQADESAAQAQLLAAFDAALVALQEHRRREGEALAAVIRERADRLAALVQQARVLAPQAQQAFEAKLRAALEAIATAAPEERLRQEVALLAQRADVQEELDRLEAHLKELAHTLARCEPVGKRLDFLMQEFQREANTLAAKAALPELSALALEMKTLIEQMREQVQNIE